MGNDKNEEMNNEKRNPWRPRAYHKEAFEIALDEKIIPNIDTYVTLKSMSLELEIDYDTFKNYIKEYEMEKTFSYLKERVEANIVNGATRGQFNHNMVKHNLDNNFGWKQKQEVDHQGNQNITIVNDSNLKIN